MVRFEITEVEGMHRVQAQLRNAELRADAGALSFLNGDISVDVPRPTRGQVLAALFAGETLFRPRYRGTGEVFFEPALGGFHVLELNDEEWFIEAGAYWASDGDIEISIYRERTWVALWTGEGLFQFRTRIRGTGQVVLQTPGPVQEVRLAGGQYRTEGKIVVARSADITYNVTRPTGRFFDFFLAGEGFLKSFDGTGRILVCPIPYWKQRLREMLRHS